MKRASYKGYVIEANPRQLTEDGRWDLNIAIERHTGDGVDVRPYSAANTFLSKEEAIEHCLNFGRQIIDRNVKGCTAP